VDLGTWTSSNEREVDVAIKTKLPPPTTAVGAEIVKNDPFVFDDEVSEKPVISDEVRVPV